MNGGVHAECVAWTTLNGEVHAECVAWTTLNTGVHAERVVWTTLNGRVHTISEARINQTSKAITSSNEKKE